MSDLGDEPDILVEATRRGSSSLENDTILILRIQAGDREALAILYERYLPSVWRYVYSQLRGDEATSRDVVSETFLAVIQNVGRLDAGATNVAGWLRGVARHKLADHWRRSASQSAARNFESPRHETDPVVALDASELRQAVGQAMDHMDDLDRVVLEWKYLDGLTVRDIAERLGRTEKAIEGILYRARAAFPAEVLTNTGSSLRRPLHGCRQSQIPFFCSSPACFWLQGRRNNCPVCGG